MTRTFRRHLEDTIVNMQMWQRKRQDDMPVTAGRLGRAIRHLELALESAKKGQ